MTMLRDFVKRHAHDYIVMSTHEDVIALDNLGELGDSDVEDFLSGEWLDVEVDTEGCDIVVADWVCVQENDGTRYYQAERSPTRDELEAALEAMEVLEAMDITNVEEEAAE